MSRPAEFALSGLAGLGALWLAWVAYQFPSAGVLSQTFGLCVGLAVALCGALFNPHFRMSAFVLGVATALAGAVDLVWNSHHANPLGPVVLAGTGLTSVLARGFGRPAGGNKIGMLVLLSLGIPATGCAVLFGKSMVLPASTLAFGLVLWFVRQLADHRGGRAAPNKQQAGPSERL